MTTCQSGIVVEGSWRAGGGVFKAPGRRMSRREEAAMTMVQAPGANTNLLMEENREDDQFPSKNQSPRRAPAYMLPISKCKAKKGG